MARYLMGIDNGGTVAKVGIFTTDGREVAVASRKTETVSPKPDWIEMDMDAIWQATAASIREVVDAAGIDPKDIAATSSIKWQEGGSRR